VSRHNDIASVSRTLRKLLAAYDASLYAVQGSFTSVDRELESRMQAFRASASTSATLLYAALERLETTPTYIDARAEALRHLEEP